MSEQDVTNNAHRETRGPFRLVEIPILERPRRRRSRIPADHWDRPGRWVTTRGHLAAAISGPQEASHHVGSLRTTRPTTIRTPTMVILDPWTILARRIPNLRETSLAPKITVSHWPPRAARRSPVHTTWARRKDVDLQRAWKQTVPEPHGPPETAPPQQVSDERTPRHPARTTARRNGRTTGPLEGRFFAGVYLSYQ